MGLAFGRTFFLESGVGACRFFPLGVAFGRRILPEGAEAAFGPRHRPPPRSRTSHHFHGSAPLRSGPLTPNIDAPWVPTPGTCRSWVYLSWTPPPRGRHRLTLGRYGDDPSQDAALVQGPCPSGCQDNGADREVAAQSIVHEAFALGDPHERGLAYHGGGASAAKHAPVRYRNPWGTGEVNEAGPCAGRARKHQDVWEPPVHGTLPKADGYRRSRTGRDGGHAFLHTVPRATRHDQQHR